MMEREELDKLNSYNPFGKSGAGAPIRDHMGNVVATRKTIANDHMHKLDYSYNNNTNNQSGGNKNDMNYYQQVNNYDTSNLNRQSNMYTNNNNSYAGGNQNSTYGAGNQNNYDNYNSLQGTRTGIQNHYNENNNNTNIQPNNNSNTRTRNDGQYNYTTPYTGSYNFKNQHFNTNINDTAGVNQNNNGGVDTKHFYNYSDFYDYKTQELLKPTYNIPLSNYHNSFNQSESYKAPNTTKNIQTPYYERQTPRPVASGKSKPTQMDMEPEGSILPINPQDEEQMAMRKYKYKSYLQQQIEDKKNREDMLKRQEKDLDKIEEEKYYEYL
jgi:hypothetical protein